MGLAGFGGLGLFLGFAAWEASWQVLGPAWDSGPCKSREEGFGGFNKGQGGGRFRA